MPQKTELTSRQLQAIQMKQKILETTIRLYQTQDYESVTIADICRAAEISTGNFYHYFKSKDDVLYEGYEKLNRHFEENADELPCSPLKRIEYILSVYLGSIEHNGYRFMSIFLHHEILQRVSYEDTPMRSTFIMLRDALEEAVSVGELKDADVSVLFYDIYRLLKGTTFDWVVRQGAFSLRDEFFRIYHQMLIPYSPVSD